MKDEGKRRWKLDGWWWNLKSGKQAGERPVLWIFN
jgi:hypothetical protein